MNINALKQWTLKIKKIENYNFLIAFSSFIFYFYFQFSVVSNWMANCYVILLIIYYVSSSLKPTLCWLANTKSLKRAILYASVWSYPCVKCKTKREMLITKWMTNDDKLHKYFNLLPFKLNIYLCYFELVLKLPFINQHIQNSELFLLISRSNWASNLFHFQEHISVLFEIIPFYCILSNAKQKRKFPFDKQGNIEREL